MKSFCISENEVCFNHLHELSNELEFSVELCRDFSFIEHSSNLQYPKVCFIDSSFLQSFQDITLFVQFQKEFQVPVCYIQRDMNETIDFSEYPFTICQILYLFQPKELIQKTLECFFKTSTFLFESTKSTLRYREIINEVTNLFTLINEKSEFIYSSPSMKHLHGYEEGELKGKSFINFIHPDDLPIVMSEFQKTLQSSTYNPRIEFRLKTKMGHYVTLEAQANNQLQNPDIRAIIVNSKDITEFKSVENNLKLEEQRISKMFTLTGLGIWDYNIIKDTVVFNEQMYNLFKIVDEKTDYTFEEYLSFFDTFQREQFQIAIKESYSQNDTFYFEHLLYSNDTNETVWILHRGAVVERNLISQPTRIIGTSTDITKRKTYELELRKSHENLNKLSNNIPGLLYQFHRSIDGEYTFPYMSSSAKEMLNVEFSSTPIKLKDSLSTIHPEDLQNVIESINESAETLSIWEEEFRVIIPDKGVQWRNGISKPEVLADGTILWHGYLSDTTERKQIEEQLTIKDTVIENSINGNVIFDLEGFITYSNTAFKTMWGFEENNLNKRVNLSDLFVERKSGFAILTHLLIDDSWTGELDAKCINNSKVFFANIVATLVKAPDGSPLCIYASVVDVTEKKQIEEVFLRNQRMESIGTLAGGIAHDLNNVLTPILLSIEILKLQTKDDKFLRRLELIENSTKRGAELIKQVLHFSRGVEGERTSIPLTKLTDEMVMIMTSTFPKNIHHSIMIEQNIPDIVGDYTQLHQVLLNLCVNARDAMPEGGLISISIKKITNSHEGKFSYLGLQEEEYIQLSVSDTGTGMPKEVREKVFEPFFTTKEIGRGTGIGLSTVMSIVKSHKATIDLSSEEGKGTTFDIYFPIVSHNNEEHHIEQIHTTAKTDTGILVVDDEDAIREFSTLALEPLGFTVFTACDFNDALNIFNQKKNQISLLIIDMILPGPDGKEIIKTIRSEYPTIPCLAVSGVYHTFDEDACFNNVVFLQKPYTTSQFISAVQNLLK
ncbi:MAG: PAS domain S-box protein [Candidatus Kapabacteria bacterium]|nr:PAS domain S-box protein [Candidatus Kapabacteria bacterium]